MTLTTAPPSLWRNTRYITWLASDTSKGLAAALFSFAIPLLTLMVTNDPILAGIIGAVGMAARTITTLIGGVLADRHRRITLMLLGGASGIVLSVAFTLFALANLLSFPVLLLLTALLAARSGLFDVAGEAAIKEIVPGDAMGRAQAANQARDAALQLVGGPLGGVLLAVGGWLVGAFMTAAHVVSTVTAWMLRRTAPHTESPTLGIDRPAHGSGFTEMREGFAWLFSRPDLRGILFISTIINLGFNAAITTVIYAMQQKGETPTTIGWVSAGIGAVMLGAALISPMLVTRVRAGRLVVAGLVMATLGALTLTLAHSVWAITAVLGASVLLLPALNSALLGYFMVATPSELLGRANSANMTLSLGAMPLAPLIAGVGLSTLGREGTLLISVVLCAIGTLLAITNRGLRSLPAEASWTSHAAQFETRP